MRLQAHIFSLIPQPRLGDFLRELDLTEDKATGIPIIKKSLEDNGSTQVEFETDEDRSYFQVILRIHPDFIVKKKLLSELVHLSKEDLPSYSMP